jgi:hypothetical protein
MLKSKCVLSVEKLGIIFKNVSGVIIANTPFNDSQFETNTSENNSLQSFNVNNTTQQIENISTVSTHFVASTIVNIDDCKENMKEKQEGNVNFIDNFHYTGHDCHDNVNKNAVNSDIIYYEVLLLLFLV